MSIGTGRRRPSPSNCNPTWRRCHLAPARLFRRLSFEVRDALGARGGSKCQTRSSQRLARINDARCSTPHGRSRSLCFMRWRICEWLRRFLKRKCCQGLPERDCEAALHTAVALARTTRRFYEKKCFDLPRTTARYYELLFSLAKLLERKFPNADPYLTMKGCGFVEMHWVL